MVETYIYEKPDIAIDTCKSIFEEISKLIVHLLLQEPLSNLNSSTCDELFKKGLNALEAKSDASFAPNLVNRLGSSVHYLGELRNQHGDISHGKASLKEQINDVDFSEMVIGITDSICTYMIRKLDRLMGDDEIRYDENDEFNKYLDEQYPLTGNVRNSKTLYDQERQSYLIQLSDFKLEQSSGRMMSTQPEKILENNLIAQLQTLGFEKVPIKDEDALTANLKGQMEKHNKVNLSDAEFRQVLAKLAPGNIFEKAKILRDRVDYVKDTGDVGYIELIDKIMWCKNEFQVTHQVTMEGKYTNRYDVTLLINGLPLVHIELKRRGLELKEAFNQTNRYHCHSFLAGYGLFGYIQLFAISNGINTKYFANNPVDKRDFKQTFFWTDQDNKRVTQLCEFAEIFLEKCQISKLITKYVVLNESLEMLMVLRPYQYHAVEAIVERVKNTEKFGYIWHTTGSGKTLTSFKAAQILTQSPHVHKVVFVVDRKDLDYQTIREFNSFREGSVDATNNTGTLVKQFGDDTPLIVTTLQKLDIAIVKNRYSNTMAAVQDKRMVFIFDECHRSQFGNTHKRIREYFPSVQMFGFTGTPIFAENSSTSAHGKRTTKDLFGECLHKYVITDAIRDENVLRFSVEYIPHRKAKRQHCGL